MTIAEKVERHVLGTIRVFGLIAFVAVLIALILLMFSMLGQVRTEHVTNSLAVSAHDVLSRLPASELANDSFFNASAESVIPPDASGLTVPAPLRAMLAADGTTQTALSNWLTRIPADDRQAFVTELSAVIALARQHSASWEWDNRDRYVASAMNEYAQMKLDRIASERTALSVQSQRTDAYRASLGILLGLTAMLSIGVTLLAIERNTRALRQSAGP